MRANWRSHQPAYGQFTQALAIMATAAMLSGCMSSSDAILGFAPPDGSGSSGFAQAGNSSDQLPFTSTQKQTLAYAGDSSTLSQPSSDGSIDETIQTNAIAPSGAPTQPEASTLAAIPASNDDVTADQANAEPEQPAATSGVSNAYAPAQARGSLLSRLFSIGNSRNADPIDNPAKNAVITASKSDSASNSTTTANVDDLPGLRLDTLFEIDSGPGSETVSGGEIQLASAAGLGHLSRSGLRQQHDRVKIDCLTPDLVKLLSKVRRHYKRDVIVTSGFRDAKQNARAGGARASRHTSCEAADIQVEGVTKWQLAKYLRTVKGRGGVGTYCHTKSVHIDVGKKRDWNWRCRRR